MLNSANRSIPSVSASMPIARWLHRVFGQPSVPRVKYRLQGNYLHLLVEWEPCPEQEAIVQKVLQALQQHPLESFLPLDHPAIYQIVIYGRSPRQPRPAWQDTLNISSLSQQTASPETNSRSLAATELSQNSVLSNSASGVISDASITLSDRSLAQRGDVNAIARYLSGTLSSFGVSVKVRVKAETPSASSSSLVPVWTMSGFQPAQAPLPDKRLLITCDATYSPTPSLIAQPLAQQLRDLSITGFRDALVLIQVQGETHPDWMLRVDLTPKDEALREWGRWGDVEAITCLLKPILARHRTQLITATLKQSTLHLFCSPADGETVLPDEASVRAGVASFLDRLAPQGIHQVVLYGQLSADTEPAWIQWVDLPAAVHSALAEAPLDLAMKEDWAAIAFLLSRVLNPDLEKYLATGGIRVQLLPRGNLLHVMCDASICPAQQSVGRAIAKFLKPLQLPNLMGVRVYGRRSGQKRPVWSYGINFAARERYVPQPVPEFAVTDTLVGELLTPAGEAVFLPDLTPAEVHTAWNRGLRQAVQKVQNALLRSQLFTLHPDVRAIMRPPTAEEEPNGLRTPSARYSLRAASIWAVVGMLLTVQLNWLLYEALRRDRQQTAARQQSELSSVFKTAEPQPAESATASEDPNSFIRMPDTMERQQRQQIVLASSPILPSADIALATAASALDLPTFNSQQLDQKLALYYQRVAEEGPPDVLVLGSSRALRGVDPAALSEALAGLGYEDVSVFNFGINGATAQVAELVLQRLLTPEQLPKLIIWADGARALNSGREDVTYNGIVSSDGYQLLSAGAVLAPASSNSAEQAAERSAAGLVASLGTSYQSLDRWLSDRLAEHIPTYDQRDRLKALLQKEMMAMLPTPSLEQQIRQSGSPSAQASQFTDLALTQDMVDINGFLPLDLQFNPATYYQEYARVSGAFDRDYDAFRLQGQQTESLEALLAITQQYQVPLVFVNLPLTDQYLDSVRRQHEQTFKQYMQSVALSQDQFIFRDLAESWSTEYRYFSDPSHLNRYGAYAVALRLAQDPMIPWAMLSEQRTSQTGSNADRTSGS